MAQEHFTNLTNTQHSANCTEQITNTVYTISCFICAAGAWFNLGVAGMAGECFIRVGPVCRCAGEAGACFTLTDWSASNCCERYYTRDRNIKKLSKPQKHTSG